MNHQIYTYQYQSTKNIESENFQQWWDLNSFPDLSKYNFTIVHYKQVTYKPEIKKLKLECHHHNYSNRAYKIIDCTVYSGIIPFQVQLLRDYCGTCMKEERSVSDPMLVGTFNGSPRLCHILTRVLLISLIVIKRNTLIECCCHSSSSQTVTFVHSSFNFHLMRIRW